MVKLSLHKSAPVADPVSEVLVPVQMDTSLPALTAEGPGDMVTNCDAVLKQSPL
jgi:hypothetical protein